MPHALLSPVALGLELPPGINLFAWCMARQLDVSHRPWDVACRASPATAPLGVLYRMRRRGDRECGRIALTKQSPIATRRRSLSGSLAEMGMQGWLFSSRGRRPAPEQWLLSAACNIDRVCRGAVAPDHTFDILHRIGFGSNQEAQRETRYDCDLVMKQIQAARFPLNPDVPESLRRVDAKSLKYI